LKTVKKHFEIDDEKIQLKRIEPIYFDLPERKTRKSKNKKNKRNEDEIRFNFDEFADDLTEAEKRYLEKERLKHNEERKIYYERHKQNFLKPAMDKEEWKHFTKKEREATYDIIYNIHKKNFICICCN
jgi:hypothetical protein